MKKWLQALLFYAGFPAAAVAGWCPLMFLEAFTDGWLMTILIPALNVMLYVLLRKKLSFRFAAICNAVILLVLSVCLTVTLYLNAGSIHGGFFALFRIVAFPFLIPSWIMSLVDNMLPYLSLFF